MGRVRYSLAAAQAEATRRAEEFVARRSDRDKWRLVGAGPDHFGPPRRSSKHPVVWLVKYAPIPPDGGVIDGGELFVIVDLELGTVGPLDYWGRR